MTTLDNEDEYEDSLDSRNSDRQGAVAGTLMNEWLKIYKDHGR